MTRVVAVAAALLSFAAAPAAAAPLHVHWMRGYAAPGTPAKFNRVGMIEVGPRSARNVLVLAPGTSAGSAYFVPLARWVAHRMPGWQVWAVGAGTAAVGLVAWLATEYAMTGRLPTLSAERSS